MLRALFELTYSLISVAFSNLQWFSSLLPAATKLWPSLCFYTCVWFCSQGGLQAGRTPQPGRTPLGQADPPDQGEPPQTRQTPWTRENPPRPGRTPQDQADPPPDQADPLDQADPPRKQTPEYGLRAAGIHPTGMHSCFPIYLVSTYIVCERLSVMHEPAGVVEMLVQILTEYPPFWSSEYPPPKIKIVRVQIQEFQNTSKMKLSQSPNLRVSEYPPKWKLSQSPNPRVSEYPPWELSQSPNLRVSEYPPKLKTLVFFPKSKFHVPQNTPIIENFSFLS